MTARADERHQFTADGNLAVRLDIWLGDHLDLSRSQLKRLIDKDLVTVNGAAVKAGYQVQEGDLIDVLVPGEQTPPLKAESIPLEIIYEDAELAIINKPKGLVVHPGVGNLEGTLVNALLAQFDTLAEGSGEHRPGIVHRLDKDTSGLMMIAKTNNGYTYLAKQLKSRLVERHYLALVHGVMSVSEGCIAEPIGRHPKERTKMTVLPTGREAQTVFKVEKCFSKHSLVRCRLITGRMHQIRVHLASIQHPLVGDMLYGFHHNNLGAKSQVLHASFLGFRHPNGEYMEFDCDPDAEFLKRVEIARQMN